MGGLITLLPKLCFTNVTAQKKCIGSFNSYKDPERVI